MSDGKEDLIPYDPEWWAEFNSLCQELTEEDLEGMSPQLEDWERAEGKALKDIEKDILG